MKLALEDTVFAQDTGLSGGEGAIVGAPPIWKDGSDATYAEFVGQYSGPFEPEFLGSATVDITARDGHTPTNVRRAQARFRLAAIMGTNVQLPRVSVTTFADEATFLAGELVGAAPTTPGWVTYDLTGDMEILGLPGECALNIFAYSYTVADAEPPIEEQRWRVYEAELLITPFGEPASCRNFPADTSNSVGGGVRQWPPSKAWARSNRTGGGYG